MSDEIRFVQVKRGALEGSRILARLLKVSRCHALGLLVLLWFWVDREAKKRHACHAGVNGHFCDRDPAELLSAALDYEGEPKFLLEAMVRSGFVEMLSPTCGRVRGTSIYAELERKRAMARDRKREQRKREEAGLKQPGKRSRMSRSGHATDPEGSGSGLDREISEPGVSHSPPEPIPLFPSSPVQPSGTAPDLEGRREGRRVVREAVAARRTRVTHVTPVDEREKALGTLAGMKSDSGPRAAEVSVSFSLGYWQGLRTQFPHLGEDDTEHPEQVLERFEAREGLTGTTLVAMEVFLQEQKRAVAKSNRPLSTFCHPDVYPQRHRDARRWLDSLDAPVERRL